MKKFQGTQRDRIEIGNYKRAPEMGKPDLLFLFSVLEKDQGRLFLSQEKKKKNGNGNGQHQGGVGGSHGARSGADQVFGRERPSCHYLSSRKTSVLQPGGVYIKREDLR